MSADIPISGTIDLPPNWAGIRRYLKAMVSTDPDYAHNVNRTMGSEAADLPTIDTVDPPAPHTPCRGAGNHPSGMSCDECRPDLWGETFPGR